MASSRILDLAEAIIESTTLIHDHLLSQNLPFPSFSPTSTSGSLPDELSRAQDAVLDATSELHDLLMPPMSALHTNGSPQNISSMNVVRRFDMANSFAPNEEATFAQIAQYAGLSESVTKSILHHAMTMRIFCEPRKGVVAHTALSVFFRDRQFRDFIQVGLTEMTPAALRTVDALSKWPFSEEPNQTGFSLANNTDKPIYEVFGADSVRAKRFADSMSAFTSGKAFSPAHVAAGFDWESLGNGTVVDIGGSRGNIAIALAEKFPKLKIVVQDLESTVHGADNDLPAVISDRVSFMAHDFFKEQKVVADVYFYRWIFHNWSDKYCIKILQSLVPILRPGVRILVNEMCMPDPGATALWKEKELRIFDLGMITIQNGRERDADEWQSLFERADPRFNFVGVTQPRGSNLAIIEASWSGGFKELKD